MKTKLVLWGTNDQDERILIALQLRAKDNQVDIYTFPEAVATDEFAELMMNAWRDNQEVAFPEDHQLRTRELSMTESLLPDDLKVERTDIITRAQTEWHFIVLSSKLYQAYLTELDELKERIGGLSQFDNQIWDNLKEFWAKVQGQVRDRNLFREHANSLRDSTNEQFAKLKELRSKMDEEFSQKSREALNTFMTSLEGIEGRISEGLRLQNVFDDLKAMQRDFRESKLTREHRSKVWERLDAAFKAVKERRFGPDANSDSSPLARLKRRYDGLLKAIEKMERSIDRDRKDLEFQERKIASTDGQLESQIRQAKIKMIEERVRSKEEKLGEMMVTKGQLEERLQKEEEKASKEAAQEAAKEKIAQQIKEQQENMPEDPSLAKTIGDTLGESLGDMADTLKAVADVVSDKIEEKVDEFKNKKEEAEATAATEETPEAEAEAPAEEKDSMLGAISKTVNESLDEVIEDVKEVAEVINEKIEEKVDELKEKVKGSSEEEE